MRKMLLLNRKSELVQLSDKLVKIWSNYGKTEPYWSILTEEEYFMKNIKKNKDAFFESGKKRAEWIFEEMNTIIPDFNPKKILDYGCGVGRITKYIPNADGCDISSPHLEIAKKEAKNNFVLVEPGNCLKYYDFIFSLSVLQHVHPELMKKCIYSILDSLTINGIAYLHIPYFMPFINNVNGQMEFHFLSKEEINEIILFQNCKLLKVFDIRISGPDILDAIFIIQKIRIDTPL